MFFTILTFPELDGFVMILLVTGEKDSVNNRPRIVQ